MITKNLDYPEIELVTVDEQKEHSRITDDYEDDILYSKILASQDLVQKWLNRKLVPTQMSGFEPVYKSEFLLPFSPVISVDSVTVFNGTDDVVIDPSEYRYNDIENTLKVSSAYRNFTEFKINFTCGYGIGQVPPAVLHAIKMTCATLYEVREDVIVGTQVNEVPLSAKNIIKHFRLRSSR